MSQQGFFVTDGASFQYIDEPAIRDYFKENANAGQLAKTNAFHDKKHTQVRWEFPTDSNTVTGGVSYNYQTNTWSILSNIVSASDERRVLDSPITGSETGLIFKENSGSNANDSAMTSWARSKPMDLGDADIVRELDSIRVGFTGTGLQYRIGWSETENGTITWTARTDMDLGFHFQNLRTAGRWLHVEIYSATLNAHWEVSDLEFIGRREGTR
jgi:hypothetical protein